MEFYRMLKVRLQVMNDDKSKELFIFHNRIVRVIRMCMLFVFIVVLPFIETPNWCIRKYKDKHDKGNFSIVDPFLDCEDYDVPFSGIQTLAPTYTSTLDFLCIMYFLFSRWNRTRWAV